MKRLLIFIFAITCSLLVQAKHLEFMGIPITGTITSFQTKLLAKGCKLAKNNNQLPTGIRGFKGVFAGKDCDIFVWFNHKTKQVYKVRAVADCGESLDNAHNVFNYYKNLLKQKYDGVSVTPDMLEDSSTGEYNYYLMIFDSPVEDDINLIGGIDMFILDYDTYPTTYGVAITYEDSESSSKNEQHTLDDL